MTTKARAELARLSRELAELDGLTVRELAERHLALFGTPSRTRNRNFLKRKIAWHLQEQVEGGLSPRALEQIERLARTAPARWQPGIGGGKKPPADPRLPVPGTIVTRVHAGIEHRVTVLENGFEFRGKHYPSLSKIALEITGTSWNGYHFFFGRHRNAADDANAGAR